MQVALTTDPVSEIGLVKRCAAKPAATVGGLALLVGAALAAWAGTPTDTARADSAPPPPQVEALSVAPTALAIEQRYQEQIKPLLTKYCGDCHLDGMDKGDIDLDPFASLESIQTAK